MKKTRVTTGRRQWTADEHADENSQTDNSAACGQSRSTVGLGVNRQGDTILCFAWGETDRPHFLPAQSIEDVRHFIVAEWLGVEDAIGADFEPVLPEIMARIAAHDWDDGPLEWEFEIGGVRIEDVFMTPNDRVNRRTAASSPGVRLDDGLCPDGGAE